MHWLDEMDARRYYGRVGDPDLTALKKYVPASVATNVKAALSPAVSDPLANFTPAWVKNQYAQPNMMDNKKIPVAVQDQVKKIVLSNKSNQATNSEKKINQTELIGAAGLMLSKIRGVGIPAPADMFCLYQLYFETGGFKNSLYRLYNNPGSISYAKQKGASMVLINGRKWAKFTNLDTFFAAYKHEVSKGADPIKAKTLEDFAKRLKTNGYYEETYTYYLAGLKAAQKALGSVSLKNKPEKKSWFQNHPIWAGVVLTAGGLIIIKTFNNLVG